MITIAVLIALMALALFAVAVCIIVGGVAGLGIVADIVVAVFIIAFVIKILTDI